MRRLVRERGLEDEIEIDSAGTGGWHVGSPPDARATEAAARRGTELSGAARRFDPEAHLRLVADGATVRATLVSGPEPGDAVLEVGALAIFVAPGVTGTVDAGEHNELTAS